MKLKYFIYITCFSSFGIYAQTGTGNTTIAPWNPTNSSFAWFRGGNFSGGGAGANNIFGTRWASDIWIMTNNRNIARFTHNNLLTSWNGNSGDGLRILDQLPLGNGNLDLFTSLNAGQNETHAVFGASGQISGQNNRFEFISTGADQGNYYSTFCCNRLPSF